jgi:transposase-like protein
VEDLEVIALFMDGVVVAQQTAIVALGITRDGRKEPLGLRLGSTENAVVCTALLRDLLARGLTVDSRVPCVIDGGKGLRKARGDMFGDAAVIQRCQLHKGRNLEALVPKAHQVWVRAALRRAYRAASTVAARRQLTALVTWLETNGQAAAAASLRKGRAAERFRRIKHHEDLGALLTALGARAVPERAA